MVAIHGDSSYIWILSSTDSRPKASEVDHERTGPSPLSAISAPKSIPRETKGYTLVEEHEIKPMSSAAWVDLGRR